MKVSVNDAELFTLSPLQKKVICNDIDADQLDEDLKRRLWWVLIHKYDQCFMRLKKEWDVKLVANGITMIPTDEKAYAELVFAQPNYRDRKSREEEARLSQEQAASQARS